MNIARTKKRDRYNQIDVGSLTFLNNYYDYGYNSMGWVEWEVAAGAQISLGAFKSAESDSTHFSYLRYFVPDTLGDGFIRVRTYPCILGGTMGGRDSSHGIGDKTGNHQVGILRDQGRCWSKVYDMNDVYALTNLPENLSNLKNKSIQLSFEHESDDEAYDNVFVDSYLHFIGNPNLYPIGYKDEWGYRNKINAGETSAWNINIWANLDKHPHHPENATKPWTGGTVLVDEWQFKSGQRCSINVKHERKDSRFDEGCEGGFFYVAFILKEDNNLTVKNINYSEILEFVASKEFKNLVLSHKEASNIHASVGYPVFPVDDPDNFVLDGIALGKEVWFNKSDKLSKATFKDVKFNIGGKILCASKALEDEDKEFEKETTTEKRKIVIDKIVSVDETFIIENPNEAAIVSVQNKSAPLVVKSETLIVEGYQFTAAQVGFSEIILETTNPNMLIVVNLLVKNKVKQPVIEEPEKDIFVTEESDSLYLINLGKLKKRVTLNNKAEILEPESVKKI